MVVSPTSSRRKNDKSFRNYSHPWEKSQSVKAGEPDNQIRHALQSRFYSFDSLYFETKFFKMEAVSMMVISSQPSTSCLSEHGYASKKKRKEDPF